MEAAELLTRCLTRGPGVGGVVEGGAEGEGISRPGLNKTSRSESLLNHSKATLCFHVNFIHELTAKCLRLSC